MKIINDNSDYIDQFEFKYFERKHVKNDYTSLLDRFIDSELKSKYHIYHIGFENDRGYIKVIVHFLRDSIDVNEFSNIRKDLIIDLNNRINQAIDFVNDVFLIVNTEIKGAKND